jgi:hypothetical protein
MRQPRRLRLALALVIGLAMPMTVSAAVGSWTLLGSPLTAQVGVSTTFTLTATNEDPLSQIGCVEVSVTSHFEVEATAIANGLPWTIGDSDSHTKVTVRSKTAGGSLGLLESVVFTVQAIPLDAGTWTWSGTAYQDISCGGSPLAGVPLVAIAVTDAVPTVVPTLVPTALPTLLPTALPTVIPIPTAIPAPTATLLPSRDPGPTRRPTQSPEPAAPGPVRSEPPPTSNGAGTGTGTGSGAVPSPGLDAGRDQVAVSATDVRIDPDLSATPVGMQPFLALVVPAVLLSGPGILLILAFAAQVAGGLAWLPIVRRHLGERRARRRVRFSRRIVQS